MLAFSSIQAFAATDLCAVADNIVDSTMLTAYRVDASLFRSAFDWLGQRLVIGEASAGVCTVIFQRLPGGILGLPWLESPEDLLGHAYALK